ncbi:MAG TPA: DNA-binding response regulator [Lachnospiraceae bacterium]|uniref:response regulator transcription factor n=1 Tax=Anaerosporobacter sp. TaxID=1872529 RepID=UPI000EDADC44|nr:response regulator transcription factor [Anaerosporobacter sp.]HAB62552.1 DNA-binding response regulator [Lachnospiraceae bacterium]
MKILLVEDDKRLRKLIHDILKKEGYQVIEAGDGSEALKIFFEEREIELVILDIMLPLFNGIEVLTQIRKYSEVPVIMLTALGGEQDEIKGLNTGANDYISKPFSYEVLVARVNAIMRKKIKENESIINEGDIQVNQLTYEVKVAEETVDLNRKEYQLLIYLIMNKKSVLLRDQILDQVWGFDYEGDMRTIDTHIKTLRTKLKSCGQYIHTIRGAGYMFDPR